MGILKLWIHVGHIPDFIENYHNIHESQNAIKEKSLNPYRSATTN